MGEILLQEERKMNWLEFMDTYDERMKTKAENIETVMNVCC